MDISDIDINPLDEGMVDLDALQTNEQTGNCFLEQNDFRAALNNYERDNTLYSIFAQWLCTDKISYAEFQKLAKWTNCYTYIIPSEREILPALSDWIYQRNRYNLFNLALLVSHLAANLSLEQQDILLRRLDNEPQTT